jgi:tape measure domain-containing protein
MADTDFHLALIDAVSGPAGTASSALDALLGKIDKASASTKSVKIPAVKVPTVPTGANAVQMPAMPDLRTKAPSAPLPPGVSNAGADAFNSLFSKPAESPAAAGGGILETLTAKLQQFGLLKGDLSGLLQGVAGGMATGGVMAAVSAVQQGFQMLVSAASSAIQAVLQFGAQVATMAAQAGGAFLKAAYDASNFRGQFVRALDAIKAGGASTFDSTVAKAKEYGLSLNDTLNTVKKYRMFGFDAGTTDQLVLATAALRGLGSTDEEISRVGVAISQIKAAGKLQGDELNQLAEAGVPVSKVYESLAKMTGKSVAEVIKLKEAGGITADLATKGIIDAVKSLAGGDLEAFVRKATETVPGRWGQLVSTLQASLYQMVSGVDMKPMADALKAVTDMLGTSDAKAFIAGMGTALQEVSNGLGRIATAYMPMLKEAFAGVFNANSAAGMKDAIKWVTDAIIALGPTLKSIATGSWDTLVNALKFLGAGDLKNFDLKDTLDSVKEFGNALLDVGIAFAEGFAGPLAAITGGQGASPADRLRTLTSLVVSLGPTFKTMGQLAFLTLALLKPPLDAIMGTIAIITVGINIFCSAIQGTFAIFQAVGILSVQAVIAVFDSLFSRFTGIKLGDLDSSQWEEALNRVLELVNRLVTALTGINFGSMISDAGGSTSLGRAPQADGVSAGISQIMGASQIDQGVNNTNNVSVSVSAQGTGLDMNELAQTVAWKVKAMLPAPKDA